MKNKIHTIPSLLLALICFSSISARAASVEGDALVWWGFEGALTGTNDIDLTGVSTSTAGLSPTVAFNYENITGLNAANAGSQAVVYDGTNALKTNDPSLRLGGAQTFWMRVNLSSIPSGSVALMTRSRALNGSRGIALQISNGRLVGYVSSDGQTYEAQLYSGTSYLLQEDVWYDISMRFDPSNVLRIDLYDPMTGGLLDTLETTSNIPASISTSNSIGSGYFQVGSINNGSSGSTWSVPDGTQVDGAGVWDSYLSDSDVAQLSEIPEAKSGAIILGLLVLAMVTGRRVRR
mgnify:CR=1 FL=1